MEVLFFGFLSGVGVTLVGAGAATLLTHIRERRRMSQEQTFKIYMKLHDLHARYFWVSGAELQKESVPSDVLKECQSTSWQIADLLRVADSGFKPLEETLDILLGSSFSTARERYEAMGLLIDRLGKSVNPRYTKKIRQISDDNVRRLAEGHRSNAPGSLTP